MYGFLCQFALPSDDLQIKTLTGCMRSRITNVVIRSYENEIKAKIFLKFSRCIGNTDVRTQCFCILQ